MKFSKWMFGAAFVVLGGIAVAEPVVSVGAPLAAPLPSELPAPLPAGAFAVPILMSGAVAEPSWQFDLNFDPLVVQVVDPGDGSGGIYGALFDLSDPSTQAFILTGFVFNALGLVEGIAGSYPGLLDGITGSGPIAYVLFDFVTGAENADPRIRVGPGANGSVPEPGSMALVCGALAALALRRRRLPH